MKTVMLIKKDGVYRGVVLSAYYVTQTDTCACTRNMPTVNRQDVFV